VGTFHASPTDCSLSDLAASARVLLFCTSSSPLPTRIIATGCLKSGASGAQRQVDGGRDPY